MKLILLMILLFSCSTPKKLQNIETVSVEKVPVNTETEIQLNEVKPDELIEKNNESERLVSITIYSSLYPSFALLTFFKEMESKEINITQINTMGFATLISALYAKDKNLNNLEWKLFGLMKDLTGVTAFTKKWERIIEDFSKKEFKDLKLSELKVKVSVPIYKNEKLYLEKSIKVVDAIMNSIRLGDKNNFMRKPSRIEHLVRLQGFKLNFSISLIPKEVKFSNVDGYYWGLITTFLSSTLKNENIRLIRSSNNIIIDEITPVSVLDTGFKENIIGTVEDFEKEIKRQRDEDSSSSF